MYEIANNDDEDSGKGDSIVAINIKYPSPKYLSNNLSTSLCRPLERHRKKDWISLWELQEAVINGYFFIIYVIYICMSVN